MTVSQVRVVTHHPRKRGHWSFLLLAQLFTDFRTYACHLMILYDLTSDVGSTTCDLNTALGQGPLGSRYARDSRLYLDLVNKIGKTGSVDIICLKLLS